MTRLCLKGHHRVVIVVRCGKGLVISKDRGKMSFQKLTVDVIRKLRPTLQSQLPLSTQILNIVDMRLQEVFLKDSYKTVFYGIPGTEVISLTWTPPKALEKDSPAINLIYIPSSVLKTDANVIAKAYQSIIDWGKPQIFESVPAHFVPQLEKIGEEGGGRFTGKTPIVLLASDNVVKKLDTKQWEIRNADKFEIDSLSKTHSLKINDNWKYAHKGTDVYLAELISFGCAKGVFRKGQRSKEALVSWGMLTQLGTSGCLHSMEEVRGNGLARWVYEESIKSMAEKYGLIPVCEVEASNTASRKLMEKIGMTLLTNLVYLTYSPSTR